VKENYASAVKKTIIKKPKSALIILRQHEELSPKNKSQYPNT
jgi:hypothetical protein